MVRLAIKRSFVALIYPLGDHASICIEKSVNKKVTRGYYSVNV